MILPKSFLDSLEGIAGFNRADFINAHENQESISSIRFNPHKWVQKKPDTESPIVLPLKDKIPWCDQAYYLKERPLFPLDPLWHAGFYYVQEASSMFLDFLVRKIGEWIPGTSRVLDLCAAPGGKTTLMSSIPASSLVVSNEVIKNRVPVLYENSVKWGAPSIWVSNNDPRDFKKLQGFFDMILVDAPCSGSGLFRKDPDAINEWSLDHVRHCAERQRRILLDSMDSLRKGGILIYSTCSYSREENEEIVDWLCEEFEFKGISIEVPGSWGIVSSLTEKTGINTFRFFPDQLRGEGFFIACLQKTIDPISERIVKRKEVKPVSPLTVLKEWIDQVIEVDFYQEGEDYLAVPKKLSEDFQNLSGILRWKKKGVRMGKIIKEELVPDHELAMSTIMNKDIPFFEAGYDDSLQYLRRNPVEPGSGDRGWKIVKYQGVNLGWIKSLGTRVNNYYPLNWRLLKL